MKMFSWTNHIGKNPAYKYLGIKICFSLKAVWEAEMGRITAGGPLNRTS
jgi:hypothetical protein